MISGYIDRFEGNFAVILLEDGDHQIDIPKGLLDENLNEGDYITISIAYDAERTEDALREAMELMKE